MTDKSQGFKVEGQVTDGRSDKRQRVALQPHESISIEYLDFKELRSLDLQKRIEELERMSEKDLESLRLVSYEKLKKAKQEELKNSLDNRKIAALHEYNFLKDRVCEMVGQISEVQGVSLESLSDKYSLKQLLN